MDACCCSGCIASASPAAARFFNKWSLDIESSLPIKVVVDTPVKELTVSHRGCSIQSTMLTEYTSCLVRASVTSATFSAFDQLESTSFNHTSVH